MTMEEIDCLRNVDIMTVDPGTLVDRSTVHVDENLPRDERLRQYVQQIKNPYCFLDEGVVVKVSFMDVPETINDRLLAYLKNC